MANWDSVDNVKLVDELIEAVRAGGPYGYAADEVMRRLSAQSSQDTQGCEHEPRCMSLSAHEDRLAKLQTYSQTALHEEERGDPSRRWPLGSS